MRALRFLAALLVAAAAAGVLAATAVVVRHNTARAGASAGLNAAAASCPPAGCATPTAAATTAPPVDHIATFVKIRPGQAVWGTIIVRVVLRRGVDGPVRYYLDGPGPSHFRGTARKPPWSFPDNSKVWNTRKVPDGRYTLSVAVGSGPIEQQVGFIVANHRDQPG